MKLKLICAALGLALLCTACGAPSSETDTEPTATPASTPATSTTFKEASQYDYKNYTDSQGLDENGMFEGVKALDYVTLPEDYKNLTVEESAVAPSDEQVAWTIDTLVGEFAPAANGDTVNIDYVGSVDGVEFVGGNTNGMGSDLTLGDGKFIDGFEDQIVGHKVGEHFDITVTFPEGYNDSTDGAGNPITLSGKEAVFAITLNHIDYAWELTDSWIQENMKSDKYNVSTVEELKNYVTSNLKDVRKEGAVMDALVKSCSFGETPPEPVLDYMVCRYLSSLNQYAELEGVSLEEFIAARQFPSVDELLAYNEEAIVDAVKNQMVIQAVVEDAGLKLDPAVAAEYEEYVEHYGQPYVNQYAMTRQVTDLLLKGLTVK